MRSMSRRRPSASMVVAITALIFALSGTAAAAGGLLNGDNTIKKHSLSGNRLRNHTITGTQVNLNQLGKVPSAKNADNASKAAYATHSGYADHTSLADNATNATNAANAGRAQSSAATDNIKTWYMTASIGQTVTLLTIGPFTYTGQCTSGPIAQTYVRTSQSNSAADSYAANFGYTSDERNPFGPSDGAISVGYDSSEHTGPGTPQWVGPYDGSDTQISGDGHTFVNTFASVGSKLFGADCVFVGHALVITH